MLFIVRALSWVAHGEFGSFVDEELEEGEVFLQVVEAFGVPLYGGEERHVGVLEGFDDGIGCGGDDAEIAADAVDGLLVVGVGDDVGLADGTSDLGVEGNGDGVGGAIAFGLAVLDGVGAGQVGEELMEAAAAVDVDELAAEADAESGEASVFDVGEQGEFEGLAAGVDGDGVGMPRLAVDGRVEVIAADEEDAVEEVEDLGDEGEVGAVGDGQREAAGLFDGDDIGGLQLVAVGLLVDVHRQADDGAFHTCVTFQAQEAGVSYQEGESDGDRVAHRLGGGCGDGSGWLFCVERREWRASGDWCCGADMAVQFIIGRAGSGKSHRCFRSIVEALREEPLGRPIYWVLPRQSTFVAERQLTCGSGLGGFCRARVISFDELCKRVLEECGGAATPEVNGVGRQMILGQLLRQRASELRFFGKVARQPGLAAEVDAALTEMEHCCMDEGEVDRLVEDLGGSRSDGEVDAEVLRAKLHDLRMLQKAYSDYVGGHHLEEGRRMAQVLRSISDSTRFRGSTVYVDEFSKFNEFERRVLARLARICGRMEITLLMDGESRVVRDRAARPDELSLFHCPEETYRRLMQAFGDEGVVVEKPLVLREAHRFASGGLRAVERGMFGEGVSACDAGAREIELVEAPDRRCEVSDAARTIKRYVREGLRLREIAVLVRQWEPYHDLISAAFREHGIRCFIDRRRSMGHHPLLQFVRSVLAIAEHDWPHEAVMMLIKSGLGLLSSDEADRLENYVLEHHLRGGVWARQEPWTFSRAMPSSPDEEEPAEPDESAQMDALRRRLAENIAPFVGAFAQADATLSIRQIVTEVFGLFGRFRVRETLEGWIDGARGAGEHEQASEHEQAWSELVELLGQVVELLGREAVTLGGFHEILESGLASFDLALTPPTVDEVLVGQIDRTRTPEVKAVLLLGMNEGVFPCVPREGSIFSDAERIELRRRNVDVEPDTQRRLLDEDFLAYVAFTRSTERLYVSRSSADDAAHPLGPSPYFRRLGEMFPSLQVRCVPRDERMEAGLISTPRQLLGGVMRWVRSGPDVQSPGPWAALYQFVAAHPADGGDIDLLRGRAWKSLTYENKAALSASVAGVLMGRTLSASVSQIETFASCPYRHFARYALRLQARDEEELVAINLDSVFHRILESIVREMLRRRADWKSLSPQEAERMVRTYAAEIATTLRGEMTLSNARNRYVLERIERALEQLIASQQAVAQRRLFRTAFSKVEFGPDNRTLPALVLGTPKGNQVVLSGRIDRIDVLEDQAAAAVIDYRLSGDKLNLVRVYHGLSLQLLTYLLVLQSHGEKLTGRPMNPAAAFYVRLLRQLERVDHPADALDPADPNFAIGERQRGIFDGAYFRAIDSTPGCTSSDLVAAYVKKDGTFGNKQTTDVAEPGEFAALLKHAKRQIARLSDEILDGRIEIAPYRIGTATPCPTCPYRSVCRFDAAINRYRQIRPRAREEVLRLVTEEADDE